MDAEGAGEEEVGKFGVAGQGGAVHVGGDDTALHNALNASPRTSTHVVAHAAFHLAEWGGVGAEGGAAHVVFESGEGGGEAVEKWVGLDFPDGALGHGGGVDVEDADAGDFFAVGGEAVAEDLSLIHI